MQLNKYVARKPTDKNAGKKLQWYVNFHSVSPLHNSVTSRYSALPWALWVRSMKEAETKVTIFGCPDSCLWMLISLMIVLHASLSAPINFFRAYSAPDWTSWATYTNANPPTWKILKGHLLCEGSLFNEEMLKCLWWMRFLCCHFSWRNIKLWN